MSAITDLILDHATTLAGVVGTPLEVLRDPTQVEEHPLPTYRSLLVYVMRQNRYKLKEIGEFFRITDSHVIIIHKRFTPKAYVFISSMSTAQQEVIQHFLDGQLNGIRELEIRRARVQEFLDVPDDIIDNIQTVSVKRKIVEIVNFVNDKVQKQNTALSAVQTKVDGLVKEFDWLKKTL